jgi:hypothetical protein
MAWPTHRDSRAELIAPKVNADIAAEPDRRRGAQQALIAARIAKANELGAGLIVAETLTMLESSLGNLERAGFREVYEKEVYRQPET